MGCSIQIESIRGQKLGGDMAKMHINLCIVFSLSSSLSYCIPYYDEIKRFLSQYQRPITVLELGPYAAHVSLQIARDFNATCVMLTDDRQRAVFNACESQSAENVILLKRRITFDELTRLGECEHFDVVLLLNGFDPLLKDDDRMAWETGLQKAVNLGDHCIMVLRYGSDHENPIAQVRPLFKGEIRSLSDDGHTMLAIHSKQKKYIYRTQWKKIKKHHRAVYIVASSFAKKYLIKKQIGTNTPWIRGINLSTFKGLGGVYPTLPTVIGAVKAYENLKHNDICMGNMVIQGNAVVPIDFNDPRRNANFKKHFDQLILQLQA